MNAIQKAKELKANPNFSHVTTRQWCGCETISVYFRNPESPSGVFLETGWSDADTVTKTKAQAIEELAAIKAVFENIYQGPTRGDIAQRGRQS